jgi:serine/threonine protein kinase
MSNLVTLRPRPGDVVERVYHVECELWSDSTSSLLGAVVPATGKRYALHCWLDEHGAQAAVTMQQFVRVANFIRLFEQPGIVEVFGVGRTNGVFYSVTEWLEGMTLERFLERHGRLSPREALALLLPCLEGLSVAHSGGITHGDVRPDNVFVCRPTRTEPERGRLRKFDSGRWPERPSGFKRWFSNDLYQRQFVSPEELQGGEADARTDVYAMGVVMYVVLAGQSPFAATTLRELDRAILTGTAKPLSTLLPALSPGLVDLIARSMSLDPAARFNNMAALLAQLARVEGHEHSSLAKYAPDITSYRWITPASQCVHPSLFDLPVVAPDELDQRRSAGFSRVLRACLVLALCLLSATMLHRSLKQPELPLLSLKPRQQREQAASMAMPAAESLQFTPLVVPTDAPAPAPSSPSVQGAANAQPRAKAKVVAVKPAPAPASSPPTPAAPVERGIEASALRRVLGTSAPAELNAPAVSSSSAAPLPSRHSEVLEHMQLQ